MLKLTMCGPGFSARLILTVQAKNTHKGAKKMSAEENKGRDRMIVEEVFNTGNFARLDELVVPGIAEHLRRDIGGMLRQAFPDLHYTIEDQLAEGDRTAVRVTITGTNTGSFRGRPPTGKFIRWTGIVISRHAGDKVVEQWIQVDTLSVMQQLGLVPAGVAAHAGE
jgi:predicted ester cyclase